MAKTKAAKLLLCMIVEQLFAVNFGKYANDEVLKSALEKAKENILQPLGDWLMERIKDAGLPVIGLYIVLHDKDLVPNYSIAEGQQVMVKEIPHVHIFLIFESKDKQTQKNGFIPATIPNIAKTFDIKKGQIECTPRGGGGKFALSNTLSYACHAKDVLKYQYPPTAVLTVMGEPFEDLYERLWPEWQTGRGIKTAKKAREQLPLLRQLIADGELTKDEIMQKGNPYRYNYIQFRKEIDDAFNTYATLHFEDVQREYELGDVRKTIIYFVAAEGTGKSKTTKRAIAEIKDCFRAEAGKALSAVECANVDPMQQTNADDILTINDVRAHTLDAGAWTMFTDPENVGWIKSRHTNRPLAAKLEMLTAPEPPQQLFYEVAQQSINEDEPIGQFIRRLSLVVEVLPSSTYEGNRYRLYTPYRKYIGPENPTQEEIENMTPDERFEMHTYQPYFLATNVKHKEDITYTSPWGLSPSIKTYSLEELVKIIKGVFFKNQTALVEKGKFSEVIADMPEVEYDYDKHWGEVQPTAEEIVQSEYALANLEKNQVAIGFARGKCSLENCRYVEIKPEDILPDDYVVPLWMNELNEVVYYTYGKTFREVYRYTSDLPLSVVTDVVRNIGQLMTTAIVAELKQRQGSPMGLPYDELCKVKAVHAAMTYDEICRAKNTVLPAGTVSDDEPF